MRVALIGANGHGRWHRRQIAELEAAGVVELAALVDVRPIEPGPEAAPHFTDHRAMLREAAPDVVVICTPPYTHRQIATDALRAGADVLLEKPPVLSRAEHRALSEVLRETGRACQVGFQALGSAALHELRRSISYGVVGTVTGVATVAAWQRDDAYYRRSPWAGKRTVDGRPALDGALANPLAHAWMQCLAIMDGDPPVGVELERYRCRDIEVDDTACLRITLASGRPVVVAVTLCGEEFIPGEVVVHGTAGRAVLEYPTDRLLLPGDDGYREIPGRVNLLENLVQHRADGTPLIAPLARTEPFTAVLDVLNSAPDPAFLGGDLVVEEGEGPARKVTIKGVNSALRQAAEKLALLSELPVPWAVGPHSVRLTATPENTLQTTEEPVR
ncbi:Gfo/Idh/MocA family oxidoreductase [Phytohabitans sp. ZYX-F-186]|uniref:Gfo/Idh/MocA family oxidoreductase n=1 Tax=Phytohabitans maris TaxID=3071409 RepID=A0ABU0ZXE2_9ACTN|nr:Gfo/Idh/MocA family oxidoreductase [Phytohabitans sp. ZYX-F-186]MDQ7910642.1 Gfo/Idh/MocA family oxidoreductase [Phytohabitans sp. ZYX-F-186]